MSGHSSLDYKALFLKLRKQEKGRKAKEKKREFIQHCHKLLWQPLRAKAPSRSTTGTIPAPTRKYCPLRLRPWTHFCRYLQPTEVNTREQDLETYKRLAVEDHVHDIITKLFDGNTSTLLTTEEVIKPNSIPMEEPEKLEYNTTRLVGLAIVQEYHVMVPLNNPGTLFYDLGKSSLDRTPVSGAWRNNARAWLPIWHTSFNSNALSIKHTSSKYTSLKHTASKYLPLSSPLKSPIVKGRRMATRSFTRCAPPLDALPQEDSLDSDADHNTSTRQKQGISQVTLSPPGLQQGGAIDPLCPNTKLHVSGRHSNQHPVNAGTFVQMLKEQLDKDLDHNFTLIGFYGVTYRYTIEVSREADGGKDLSHLKLEKSLRPVIKQLLKEINSLGNIKLNQALIINFH
ncbi:hypothetical protein BJY00DRAFT_324907 [Aspergillus carlsbadensis]|nr:hypothetical protein BJY00DRAFT_324907 [Aspergillus carlsbadensis]